MDPTEIVPVTKLLFVGVVVAFLARLLLGYAKLRRLELAMPGPDSVFLLGNINIFWGASGDDILRRIMEHWNPYVERGFFRLSLFHKLLIVVSDPATLDHVFRSKDLSDKPGLIYRPINDLVGDGLVVINGPKWKAHRKALSPAFHKEVLDRFVPIIQEASREFAWRVRVGEEQEVITNIQSTVVLSFLRTAIDIERHSKIEHDLQEAVIDLMEVGPRAVNDRSFKPLFWSQFIYGLTRAGRLAQRGIDRCTELSWQVIGSRRAEPRARHLNGDKDGVDGEGTRKPLLETMLHPDTGFTDDELIGELQTFVGGAIETSSSALTWTMKMLSLYPELQQRIVDEVDEVFGGPDADREWCAADLQRLDLMERFIKETMRLLPAVPFIARLVKKPTVVAGYKIPPGSSLVLNIMGAHRDPEHWPDPLRFDPDRFLPENSVGRHPRAYLPFSSGARNCIGGQYAMMNMKILLATVLREFRIEPVDDGRTDPATIPMAFDIASREVGGTRVRLTLRRAERER